ncbi:small, acid-soluble spore protein L [Priestia megaterium]|uniref:small, acid-soluble spore protein L n=1 Tax=Priestia megaterium TaxID=1404 RepID=UPI003C2EEB9B
MGTKKSANRGQVAPGVNPQGHGKDVEFSTEPKSELENKAKKIKYQNLIKKEKSTLLLFLPLNYFFKNKLPRSFPPFCFL